MNASKAWRVAPGDPTCVFTGDLAKPIKCGSKERAALVVAAVNAYERVDSDTDTYAKVMDYFLREEEACDHLDAVALKLQSVRLEVLALLRPAKATTVR